MRKFIIMKYYEIMFPGGWCYIFADKIITNKESGQRVFYNGENIVAIIRLDTNGMLITEKETIQIEQ
jgi:hypothetical protein